jgi:hypothetical protein
LLARAASHPENLSLADLTPEKVCAISAREGVDFATALLYERVRRSPQHSAFIAQIDGWQPANHSIGGQDVTIGVVPAAFYRENPDSGADGGLVLEEAHRLGFRAVLIPVSSNGTLQQNAKTILDWLADHRGERIILVSLCKGGPDVKSALSRPDAPEHFRQVSAWVNICGTLNGSLVAEWMLASKPSFFIAWLYCKYHGSNLDFLRELVPSAPGPLSAPLKLPAGMRLINVVGFPLQRHLTNRFMRLCHQRVSRRGPTDGGVVLADVCALPGVMYPLWGGDHYLRPAARARRVISAVLEVLVADDNREGSRPGNEIPATDQTGQMPLA